MRIVLIGEAMLELARGPVGLELAGGPEGIDWAQRAGGWQLGHGGDTLNMALHLARMGHDAGLLTAVGSDPLSAGMVARWQAEGLDTGLVLTHPDRATGLYAILTDPHGERSFLYWRETSAARDMLALPASAAALERAAGADMLIFSLITLAILPAEARAVLYGLAGRVRERGGHVAFDGNYRFRLWAGSAEARDERDRAIALATIGLPTLEDETAISGEADADAVAAHWQGLGCAETVVKLGARGCRLADGTIVPPPEVLTPVDTSGAGDAFNAGYLGARLRGQPPAQAALAGHVLAGWTVMRAGAIPDRDP